MLPVALWIWLGAGSLGRFQLLEETARTGRMGISSFCSVSGDGDVPWNVLRCMDCDGGECKGRWLDLFFLWALLVLELHREWNADKDLSNGRSAVLDRATNIFEELLDGQWKLYC